MPSDVVMWVISGCAGAAILLLTAIWNELRTLRNKVENVVISNTALTGRILILEKMIDKLPCVSNFHCPTASSKENQYHA